MQVQIFLLKSKTLISQGTNYKFVFTYLFVLKHKKKIKTKLFAEQMLTDNVTDHNALHNIAFKREILDLYRQLNQDSSSGRAPDLEVQALNPGPGSNFSLELKL